MATDPDLPHGANEDQRRGSSPLSGTRSQSMQRLQIGLFGLAAMVLLVSLANIILNSAEENEARVVPGAAPTVSGTKAAAPVSDPLADAGVVPERAERLEPLDVPEQPADAPAIQP